MTKLTVVGFRVIIFRSVYRKLDILLRQYQDGAILAASTAYSPDTTKDVLKPLDLIILLHFLAVLTDLTCFTKYTEREILTMKLSLISPAGLIASYKNNAALYIFRPRKKQKILS